MIRLLIPLNLVLGACFFAVAIFYPILDQKLFFGNKKVVAEQIVENIARAEQRSFQVQERYVYFDFGGMPDAIRNEAGLNQQRASDFEFKVQRGVGKNEIVIQARVRDELVRDADLPPLTYTYVRDPDASTEKKGWKRLSGKQMGLF